MKLRYTIIGAVLTLSGYANLADAAPTDVLATVNGNNITQQMFDVYAHQRGIDDTSKLATERRQKILDELINRDVLYRVATEQKLDRRPDVAVELESARLNIMASAAVRASLEAQGELTEAKLKEGYDKYIKTLDAQEYKTRHILVESEDKAKGVIAELDKGADFAKLANENSSGGSDGGELEWFQPSDMIKPFADAAVALQKGKYTKTPVQTQYGWHIIQLQDTRKVPPPAFEAVKEQIRMSTRNASIESYINELRAKAKIEIK